MRKITREAINAFMSGSSFYKANTIVEPFSGRIVLSDGLTQGIGDKAYVMRLHGNAIAVNTQQGVIYITNAGWSTTTTKERLNAIPGVSICQKKFQWFLNGKPWNGDWITIKAGQS
jgi:hypothetical protein